jgi:hypothetical protein
MKKLSFILLLLAITCTFGCKRYPDGPLISFRSPEKRIEGTWQIVGFTSNGVDSIQYCIDSCGSNMTIQIPDPPDYWNYLWFNNRFGADWKFSDNKKILNVYFSSTPSGAYYTGAGPISLGSGSQWKILKLEMKKMNLPAASSGVSQNSAN